MVLTARERCPGGKAVARWLKANKCTQVRLAKRIGVAHSVLWRWMVGATAPSVGNATKIERITGTPSSTWARRMKP